MSGEQQKEQETAQGKGCEQQEQQEIASPEMGSEQQEEQETAQGKGCEQQEQQETAPEMGSEQ